MSCPSMWPSLPDETCREIIPEAATKNTKVTKMAAADLRLFGLSVANRFDEIRRAYLMAAKMHRRRKTLSRRAEVIRTCLAPLCGHPCPMKHAAKLSQRRPQRTQRSQRWQPQISDSLGSLWPIA